MVLFAEKAYALDESAINQLEALLPDLLGKPNKIEIRGHASRRERADIQSKEDPWQLSWMRSQVVKDFLVSKGVELGRLRLSQDGAEEPYSAKKTRCRASGSECSCRGLSDWRTGSQIPRKSRRTGRLLWQG